MDNFSLIKQLGEKTSEPTRKFPSGIDYQQYEVLVNGKERIINIPMRECDNFEQTITEMVNPITDHTLKTILRQFRGIRD